MKFIQILIAFTFLLCALDEVTPANYTWAGDLKPNSTNTDLKQYQGPFMLKRFLEDPNGKNLEYGLNRIRRPRKLGGLLPGRRPGGNKPGGRRRHRRKRAMSAPVRFTIPIIALAILLLVNINA